MRGDGRAPVTVDAVRYALAELGRARLLAGPGSPAAGVTRRELMRRLGTTVAATVPIVTSIVAPTAAQSPRVCSSPDLVGTCAHSLCETGGALVSGATPASRRSAQQIPSAAVLTGTASA
jgi:hypothetical protein